MISKIFIGIGANLRYEKSLSIKDNCLKVIDTFEINNIFVDKISNWYKSAPVPISDQPWFVNTVVEVSTLLDPNTLMFKLQKIEKSFGRKREIINGDRTIDLDIIDYNSLSEFNSPILPHPRMEKRLFVLYPLLDLEPNWVHPTLGKSIDLLITDVKTNQIIEKMK